MRTKEKSSEAGENERRERYRNELEEAKKDHEFRGTVSIIIEACAESRDQSNITILIEILLS